MLNFIVRNKWESVSGIKNIFVLTKDNWDDFGYKISFYLSFINSKNEIKKIGPLKILQRDVSVKDNCVIIEKTMLPVEFQNLNGGEFISLGQDENFYKNLFELFGKETGNILYSLLDIAWLPSLAGSFETTTAFRNALMRENTAYRSRRFGQTWATGGATSEDVSFKYSTEIPGTTGKIQTFFDFNGNDPIPGRICAIIGRNAVGKTKFLAQLGDDLAQTSRISQKKILERELKFPNGRPLFTRIIAVSYSAFDRFKRPSEISFSSYIYCGIRHRKGGLSDKSLRDGYQSNLKRVQDRGMQKEWNEHIRSILGETNEQFNEKFLLEFKNLESEKNKLSFLSSGQSILCHFVTALLAWIQPNSLILFDEPETHLHPNAVASLFGVLTEILNSYDSFAILATHSPLSR